MMRYIFCLSLLGCADDTLVIETNDYLLHDAAEKAALEWNECGGRQIRIVREPSSGSIPLTFTTPADPDIRGHFGVTFPDRIKVLQGIGPTLYPVVLHEMGHALHGPEHTREGLMASPMTSERVVCL